MSSRSIISSSLGCKCSFDHSLHFVSIYQSQGSVNPKQQRSNSKETWAARALTASWMGGVGFCLFSKLFTSKNFPTAAGLSLPLKGRGNLSSLKTGTARAKRKVLACCSKPIAAPEDRKQAQEREGFLCGQNLFYVKVCVRLLGLIHSTLKSSKPRGLTHKVLQSRSLTGLDSLQAPAAADTALRTKPKGFFLIASPGAERRIALRTVSSAMTSTNSLAPSS